MNATPDSAGNGENERLPNNVYELIFLSYRKSLASGVITSLLLIVGGFLYLGYNHFNDIVSQRAQALADQAIGPERQRLHEAVKQMRASEAAFYEQKREILEQQNTAIEKHNKLRTSLFNQQFQWRVSNGIIEELTDMSASITKLYQNESGALTAINMTLSQIVANQLKQIIQHNPQLPNEMGITENLVEGIIRRLEALGIDDAMYLNSPNRSLRSDNAYTSLQQVFKLINDGARKAEFRFDDIQRKLQGIRYYLQADETTPASNRIRLLNRAIEFNTDLHYAYNERGVAHAQLGRLEFAKKDFEKAVSICEESVQRNAPVCPKIARYKVNLARTLDGTDAHTEAVEIFRSLIEGGDADAATYNDAAWSHIGGFDPEEASTPERKEEVDKGIELAETAIRRWEGYIPLYDTLAIGYLKRSNVERAILTLKQAHHLSPASKFIRQRIEEIATFVAKQKELKTQSPDQ